jgi:hypothetical protein
MLPKGVRWRSMQALAALALSKHDPMDCPFSREREPLGACASSAALMAAVAWDTV